MKFETQVGNSKLVWGNPKPEGNSNIQHGRRRHLGFQTICCHFVAICPIFMKFCTDMRLTMLQRKICKSGVGCEKTRWRRPPYWIYLRCCNSAIYRPILMKFETQADKVKPLWGNPKPEGNSNIQHGRRRHLGFQTICCHFVAICPIFMKFCTDMRLTMLQRKICKSGVGCEKTRWRRPPYWIYLRCCNSAIYRPILMKFETQADKVKPLWQLDPKPEGSSNIQHGHRRHLEFQTILILLLVVRFSWDFAQTASYNATTQNL